MPITLQSPYTRDPNHQYRWLKGNLHAHSTLSDGSRDPQTVVDLYANLGHDFFALSDHDVFSSYTDIDPKGLILLHANEVTAFGPHILQIGGTARIAPHEDRQSVINQINAGADAFAVLNHPNWEADWDHYPFDLLLSLKGYAGIEIFNGVCLDLEGSHLAVDKWERLLSVGRIVWAFANDDSHHANHEGRGWNVVQVKRQDATPAGIQRALRAGNFYPSTGLTIDAIEVAGTELSIKSKDAQLIEIFGEKGVRLAYAQASELRFDAAKTNSFFIRAQLTGAAGRMAWTQPFLIKGGPADQRRAMEERFSSLDAPRPELAALRVPQIPALGTAAIETLLHNAPESTTFYDWRTAETPPVKTAIRALVSETQLALRIDCEEPDMQKIQARITDDGNGSLWTDESLELFIDVEAKRQRNWQMAINPNGAFFAAYPLGWHKNLRYQKRATKSATGWSVELLFDLPTLAPNLPTIPGTRLGFHVCRNRLVASRHYMWSWVGSSNHTPSRYGNLIL